MWTFPSSLDNPVKYKVESDYHQSSETRDTALLISGGNQEAEVYRQETTGAAPGPASWKIHFFCVSTKPKASMNPVNRRDEILRIVREQKRVHVEDLAHHLHISRETIRRDLTELARTGKIRKFHGGAELPGIKGEGRFQERMAENVPAKVGIASTAVRLITPGETLFIDTGSTTLYFAEKLAETSDLTIVTNSAEIARIASTAAGATQVFLLGGEFNGDNRQTIGSMAIAQIRSFRAHHAILTIGALDDRTGIMDFNINEAQIARAMVEQAESVTVLADSSKFGRIASFKVCELDRITNLVCDKPPSAPLRHTLTEAGIMIFSAEQDSLS